MKVVVRKSEKATNTFCKVETAFCKVETVSPESIIVIKGGELRKIGKNGFQGVPRIILSKNKQFGIIKRMQVLFGKKMPGVSSCKIGGMEVFYKTQCF